MRKALRALAIGIYAAFFGFPLYWVITMAFKTKAEENPPGVTVWWPSEWTLTNFKDVLGINDPNDSIFATQDFSALTPLKNSFLAAGLGTLFALIVGVFAAYGIARFRAGGSQLPFQILQLRMFPPAAVVIPLYFMFVYLHLWNTLQGLVIIYAAVTFPFVVWLMRSFSRTCRERYRRPRSSMAAHSGARSTRQCCRWSKAALQRPRCSCSFSIGRIT